MRPYLATLCLLILCACSDEPPRAPGTPEMPPTTYGSLTATNAPPAVIKLGKAFDMWSIAQAGSDEQKAKMLFKSNSDKPHSGTQCMQFVNGNDKAPNVFMTASYVVDGLKAGEVYQFSCFVRNDEGAPYHLFITDDGTKWENRTHCDQQIWENANKAAGTNVSWQQFAHKYKADKSGRVVVRLVMETKGAVSVDDCELEEYR